MTLATIVKTIISRVAMRSWKPTRTAMPPKNSTLAPMGASTSANGTPCLCRPAAKAARSVSLRSPPGMNSADSAMRATSRARSDAVFCICGSRSLGQQETYLGRYEAAIDGRQSGQHWIGPKPLRASARIGPSAEATNASAPGTAPTYAAAAP